MYCWKSGAGVPHFQGLAREVGELWDFSCATEDSKVLHQHWESTSCSSASLADTVGPDLLGCIYRKERAMVGWNRTSLPMNSVNHCALSFSQAVRNLRLVSPVCPTLLKNLRLFYLSGLSCSDLESIFTLNALHFSQICLEPKSMQTVECEWNKYFRDWWRTVFR